ncbi:molybdopterin cofactor-binding domain-containing protein [Algoriphagus namhaensis]|uniref:Molybdopterin cofactor-binding domain-containing protein n=1 Tax=Algoriphagus namhaensis TaxID=915353 RepID=A0ABV8AU64_9BACT
MTKINNKLDRRSFLKVSALAGGGMMLSFSWLAGCKPTAKETLGMPKEWFELNSYIKIGENGAVTLFSPNPEFGSNVKTSMPMILAEELDTDWKNVFVEQADFYPERYDRQFTGGSQGIRQGWLPLRTAGATARQLLVLAAAQTWQVPAGEITTSAGVIEHAASGKKANYGEMASLAGTLEVPEEVALKDIKDFKIIGTSKKNVDGKNIVTGQPMFGIDHKVEGMKYAAIVHPPAFGMKLKSFDKSSVSALPGIDDVFSISIFKEDYNRNFFDTTTFPEIVAIVGNSTWEVMQAKKALNVEWEKAPESTFPMAGRGGNAMAIKVPSGLENTRTHKEQMAAYIQKPGNVLRRDGDPEGAFKKAAKVLERTYSAPFLAHNTMEPMNCFADVKGDQAIIYGPTQAPELIRQTLSSSLGIPEEKIQINLARMGGGFGRRAYSHHMTEAALISQKIQKPVKMVYTREDDMTSGVYRPTYSATYRAALDENNELLAIHVKGGGIPESPVYANRFPAGSIDNYLAEGWEIESNITIGAFRAPRSNFIAGAEQSFLDELAEEMGKDPIEFRLELLKRAETNPVGERNDYDAKRYAGVLKLVKEKSNWGNSSENVHRGVSAYFCHNSYVAEVVDTVIKNNQPVVENVYAAVDCGIVINPDAAANMGEGAIVDGIGNAFFGEMAFENGQPTKSNFDTYRMIRQKEAPKKIEVHFVQNNEDPTGLGEPLFPPVFAAVANSLYKATGKRYYEQPFAPQLEMENLRM